MKKFLALLLCVFASSVLMAKPNKNLKTDRKITSESEVEKSNGLAIVQDEFYQDKDGTEKKEQVRVRITGNAALVLCSSIGVQLKLYEGKSFIQFKFPYTCGTTSKPNEFWAGHIVRNGQVLDLETDGYQ